jgi:hypothetical protein
MLYCTTGLGQHRQVLPTVLFPLGSPNVPPHAIVTVLKVSLLLITLTGLFDLGAAVNVTGARWFLVTGHRVSSFPSTRGALLPSHRLATHGARPVNRLFTRKVEDSIIPLAEGQQISGRLAHFVDRN